MPTWLAAFGFVTTVIMLLVSQVVPWLELLFPVWALVLSAHILVTNMRAPQLSPPAA
jgi:hypothetical protein